MQVLLAMAELIQGMAPNIERCSLKWMNPSLLLGTSRAQLLKFSGIAAIVKSPESEASLLSSFTYEEKFVINKSDGGR
ncbi:hypothetical protein Nepgr_025748 [Nepenthes gracilis]|uniref:Uncharacterized protein n=1 Tax=Nepenthes gracilis TaxID=150966 RepID=A0AAD3T6L3_NEPGR|nr:hypothetical protein Nepgr_025748 [Nepenthes gracilis]